jgi:hypothetical protein
LTGTARATLVRGLKLKELVARSHHIVVLRALDARSHYQPLGGRPCIVTDTLVRVEDVLAHAPPPEPELWIRTLGGHVGGTGQLVLGQPNISWGSPDVAFLKLGADGAHWFVGMAQGHYPLEKPTPEAALRLRASSNLPEIHELSGSAVLTLAGRSLEVARGLVQEAALR